MRVNGREVNLNGMTSSKTPGPRKNNHYEKANDQHVRGTILYADDAKKLYIDSAKTTGISSADLAAMFLIGIFIATDTGYVVPTSVSTADGVTTVTAGSNEYFSKEKE